MAHGPRALVATVERSPELVAVHDRRGWLELFSSDGVVEDPVGAPLAARGTGALGRFWDTFIAGNEIRFEVLRDCVRGLEVLRDVVIHTRIGGTVAVDVPAYLLYQLDDGAGLRVARLAAHWELWRMSLAALRLGPRAWAPMTRLFARMLSRMGAGWVAGYLSSLWRGVGRRGIARVRRLAAAVEARDATELAALFAADATVELGAAQESGRRLLTLLPAGSRLCLDAPLAAGWTVACRFTVDGPAARAGLALFEFTPGRRIRRARFFGD